MYTETGHELLPMAGWRPLRGHVAGPAAVEDRVKPLYGEASAQALLARILWLGDQGCRYPWDALRWLNEDVVTELDDKETAQ